MRQATMRSRLILGFGLVIIPLVILLLWNNLYATKVVHSQVAQSNRNMLTMYMNDMDQVLGEIENYLYKAAEQDQSLISLSQYDRDSWEYYLSTTQTANDLDLNINYYDAADVLFAYSTKYEELLIAQQQSVTYDRKQEIQSKLKKLLVNDDPMIRAGWNVVELKGQYALVRVVDTNYDSYIGAWIDLNRLMEPMRVLGQGGKAEALLVSGEGRPISTVGSSIRQEIEAFDLTAYMDNGNAAYNIVKLGNPYLLVAKSSRMAEMNLIFLLPERTLLEGLPIFRKMTYVIPMLAAIMLGLYLFFLQNSIVKPIHHIIKGMRKIRSGDLSVRMEDYKLQEFITLKETFNGMAQQIEHLKIDIYEEQIRTQKAELKHLQAQIHPHFFMNSLNIVYQLAQIKDYEVIQNMSLHLVRYFRFTTRTQVSTVTVKEEVEHIYHYLSIQKYRFPETLAFDFEVDPALENASLPPLSIQPLVENAMVHGFSIRTGTPFHIRVKISAEGGEDAGMVIEVEDNGKGFTEEQKEHLRMKVHQLEPGDGSLGLWNVVRRCRLYYKGTVRMAFDSVDPQGTIVTLRVPRNKTGEREPGQ
ncbi:two-component system, sensor histidine kinase YesM [Paenibacillus catalpae]|uniref:Two-component system, sensor histidine kinase YesM n=1 Tax=Paenibacillus catalpae TaxID=1045775 RepID=A0A1I2CV08_9BACL|nr:histidine kinase [Paenibacillus catalpae]SFE71633.1 two-component system, sensor histidine kinase YesM [Paenibacillus catalpae]